MVIATMRKAGDGHFSRRTIDVLETLIPSLPFVWGAMTSLEFIFVEIERLRVQIRRQQKDILALQRSGISTASAETLLERMRASIDGLCKKRDWMQDQSGINAPSTRQCSSPLLQ
jgi:hypothetical protein